MAGDEVHVIVAPFDWEHDGLRYRRHRLAEYLARRGDTIAVVWVSPVTVSPRQPVMALKLSREMQKNLLIQHNNLRLFRFFLPDVIPGRIMRLSGRFHTQSIKPLGDLISTLGKKRYLWFTAPAFPFLADLCPWDRVVYDCSDNWGVSLEGRRGLKEKLDKLWVKEKAEKQIVKKSGILFATSAYLRDKMQKKYGREALLVENGVELDIFNRGEETEKLKEQENREDREHEEQSAQEQLSELPEGVPRLGYVGGMKAKINFALLKELMREKSRWQLVLIGPPPQAENRDYRELVRLDNVHSTGGVKAQQVPACLAQLDAGLLPYRENEYNRAVFPLKLYEYLAAGLPVVGCGVPSTLSRAEEGVYLHVSGENGVQGFAEACEKALSWSGEKSYIDRRKSVAAQADWNKKFDFMTQAVREGRF